MKNLRLLALFCALPLAGMAQIAVFTDNFNSGSTFNGVSTPGGTPTASSTSYDFLSSKTGLESLNSTSGLTFALTAATGSGFVEAQAIFTLTPVTLATPGDYIDLTCVFTNVGNLLSVNDSTSAGIYVGLYNSGGSKPVAGTAGTSGNTVTLSTTTGSSYATGNAANWQGYVSRIEPSGGTCETYTRPIQNGSGTTSADQDVIGNGFGGGTYVNPGGVEIGGSTAATSDLTNESPYTIDYRVTLSSAGVLAISENLYGGAGTGGTLLAGQTNSAATTNVLTSSFDALAIGFRAASSSSMDATNAITQIAITKSIYGTPGPSFLVTGGGAGCPGDGYLVTLNGSVATNVYYLYTNGVGDGAIAPQTGAGSALTFGPISIVGTNTVVASNSVTGFSGVMSGSAIISVLPGPDITNQPVSQVVASGYAAIFSAGSAGGGLNYQWYKNGVALANGGHISGAETPTLTVYPATSADAATTANGYSVVITNTCGLTATSGPLAALTLAAPANIVWEGGNPNDNWDLATTPNFVNGSDSPVVFHSGDDVTFDDTAPNLTVTLAGSFLDPTLITESSAHGYVFIGSGAIAGPGALLMTGSGSLTISNANSFTGGTTINNGNVVIKDPNQMALGAGTVTLGGGTLEIGLASGASTVGVSNNINCTASSILQYDASGTYAFNLFGTLTGSPGATITLTAYLNNSSGFDRMRLYGSFTNNSPIVFNNFGNEIQFAPYNATGNQVYNGVISGSGGQILPRGAGATILNGANTFNDSGVTGGTGPTGYSLILSGSTLGVGADSVVSGGSIISSPVGTGNMGVDVTLGNVSLFASGAAHTIANPIIYTSDSNTVLFTISGSNNLTLSGQFNLSGNDGSGGTNQTIVVNNTGLTTISGVITDNGLGCGMIKAGTNALYLDAVNSYYGSTTVSNGLLAGVGTIVGPVAVDPTGTLGAGDAGAIGSLTVSSNLTVGGALFVRVNKSLAPAQSNDLFSVSGTLANTGAGTLTVSNLGPTLAVGDRFVLFSKPMSNGGTLAVTGAGVIWTNRLAVDGSIAVFASAPTVNTNAFMVTNSFANGVLKLTWPLNHTGYRLEAQTNSIKIGLSNDWVTVSSVNGVNPAQTNQVSIPVGGTGPAVFFRLIYP